MLSSDMGHSIVLSYYYITRQLRSEYGADKILDKNTGEN